MFRWKRQFASIPECTQEFWVELQLDEPINHGIIEFWDVDRREVGQFAVLQPGPYVLHRVVVGCPRRQHLQVQAAVLPKELPDDRSLVVVAAVPDDDDVAPEVLQQIAEKRDDLLRREEAIRIGGEIEPESLGGGRDTNAADDGDFVSMSAIGVNQRCVTDDRPGSPDDRIEKQAGFVDQNEVGMGITGFF